MKTIPSVISPSADAAQGAVSVFIERHYCHFNAAAVTPKHVIESDASIVALAHVLGW